MRINNRDKTILPGLACASVISLATAIPSPLYGQVSSPNILVIMTDEQAWDAISCTGNKVIKTPNLDRLASEGVIFTHAITPCPVSAPARTSILTGRFIEKTTIRLNADIVKNGCDYPTFDEILSQKGYTAEYYGKFHAPEHMARVYSNPPSGGLSGSELIRKWEPLYREFLKSKIKKRPLKEGELYEKTFYGGIVPYKPNPLDRHYIYLPDGQIPKESLKLKNLGQDDIHGILNLAPKFTITAVQAKATIDALERLKDQQFILTCSFHCPHVPIVPSEPFASMYKPENMIPPVSVGDNKSNSPYKISVVDTLYSNPEMIKYMIANYYAFVTEIDDWVGKILKTLDRLNLTENTLIIYVSDHGEMLGAHGMQGKFCFYEESVRVPLIFRYPGKIKPGQRVDIPVSTLNIFPTILDYADINGIPNDGYSLKDIINGAPPKHDFAVSEWTKERDNVPSIMIRTKNWKLMTTHRSEGPDVDVLFDLQNDPYELNNLLGKNPDRFNYKDIVEELRANLVGYLKDIDYPLTKGITVRQIIKE